MLWCGLVTAVCTVALVAFAVPLVGGGALGANGGASIEDSEGATLPAIVISAAILVPVVASFAFSHWAMMRSKRPANPSAPVTSALAYGLFVRAQSIFLLATGLVLSLVIGLVCVLSMAGVMGLGTAAVLIIVACLPIIVGMIALSVVYGQAGSRLSRRMEAAGGEACVMPADDDEHWKLGVIYFNPDDASLWLPERFGIGWTMNLARPAAWAIIGGFALITVLFVVVVVMVAS